MNQLDEKTQAWWMQKGFVATMASVLTFTLLSPSSSVAYSNDNKPVVVTEKAGERYSEIKQQKTLDFYKGKQELTKEEVNELLSLVGFTGESLRVAWAVVMKESTGRPLAHNKNRATGDNSYGIFQINMLGELGEVRRAKFNLDTNNDLFDPVVNAQIAFHMSAGGTNWSSWKVDPSKKNGANVDYYEWFTQYSY